MLLIIRSKVKREKGVVHVLVDPRSDEKIEDN